MKNVFLFVVVLWMIIARPGNCFGDQTIYAIRAGSLPVIDGKADEPAWKQARRIITHDNVANIDIKLKAVYDDRNIYFLVVFPDPDESRLHKAWVWNKETRMYETGPQREDTFIFKWNMGEKQGNLSIHGDASHVADVWFWKANRTDPAGFADDKMHHFSEDALPRAMKVISETGKTMFLKRTADRGASAYQSTLPVKYAGDRISHYVSRSPKGSRGDIRSKGVWFDGKWTIEFARKLQTGHEDDVQFHTERTYRFGAIRHEIAGRKPNPDTSQPLYGAGDISEELTLKFIR